MRDLSDVTVEYTEVIPTNKQMAEFYACGGSKDYAIVTKGDREVRVAVNGEMHLTIPYVVDNKLSDLNAEVIRYGDELENYFSTDMQFMQFVETISNSGFEVYRMNPWWEVYDDLDPEGGVYDSFYEAVEGAIATVRDDNYWNQSGIDSTPSNVLQSDLRGE